MEQNFPKYIKDEHDLAIYESKLRSDFGLKSCTTSEMHKPPVKEIPEILSNPVFFQCFLKKHIGKLIKAESLIGNRLETRVGILLDVGTDYIVIKPNRNCVTTVIDLKCVKYVSIIHDNNVRYLN